MAKFVAEWWEQHHEPAGGGAYRIESRVRAEVISAIDAHDAWHKAFDKFGPQQFKIEAAAVASASKRTSEHE